MNQFLFCSHIFVLRSAKISNLVSNITLNPTLFYNFMSYNIYLLDFLPQATPFISHTDLTDYSFLSALNLFICFCERNFLRISSAFLEVSSEQARVLSSSKYLCLIYFKFARFLAAGNPSQIAQIFYQNFI